MAWLTAAVLIAAVAAPGEARAMCCVCRDCAGAAFCVDGIASALSCANFCVAAGCPSTVFDSVDGCADGCDGAPDAPTATASPTPSETPTATPSATASATATATASGSATDTATESATPTATPTSSPSETPTITETPEESATPTATPSATPSATATGAPQLSGKVCYYVDHRPVADVDVVQLGDTPGSASTDALGNYGFPLAGPGSVAVEPEKQGDFDAAITALDATVVLQAVVNLVTLTADQRLAADVTGNGTFSALDATRILQFQAGIITRFEAADLCGSDWLFVPEVAPAANQTLVEPQLGGGVCQQGRISLTMFTPPLAGRDFRAILLGDVTGNWHAPPP